MVQIEVEVGPMPWSNKRWHLLEDAVYSLIIHVGEDHSRQGERLAAMVARLLQSAAPTLGLAFVANTLDIPLDRVRYLHADLGETDGD